jgi:predicted double-glycine peptidase
MHRRKRAGALAGLLGVCAVAGAAAATPYTMSLLRDRHPLLVRKFRAQWLGASYAGGEGVVLQRKAYDCGAAALKMVLDAHGIERELGQLEKELKTTVRGTTMLNLREVAAEAGLPGRSWALTESALQEAPLPAIAWVGGDHFVVVRRFIDAKTLEVDDPLIGRLQWPLAEFREKWAGETLVFDPRWVPAT